MDRATAISIAREAAKANPPSYYTGDDFVPHDWVVDAIVKSQPPRIDAVIQGFEDRIAALSEKIATYEAAAPGTIAMEFIRTGLQMVALLAKPEGEGPKNYTVATVNWDHPLTGVPFQRMELAMVRAGALGPHDARVVAESSLRQAKSLLRDAASWLGVAQEVDEMVDDEEDAESLRNLTAEIQRFLAHVDDVVSGTPIDPIAAHVPTVGDIEAMAQLLYEAPEADGSKAASCAEFHELDEGALDAIRREARLVFRLGGRLP